jgi:hypothetical protein
MARGGGNYVLPEGLKIVEIVRNEPTRPNPNLVSKVKLSMVDQHDTTFGPVHFMKELRVVSGDRHYNVRKMVELDDNLRGKVEKFQHA